MCNSNIFKDNVFIIDRCNYLIEDFFKEKFPNSIINDNFININNETYEILKTQPNGIDVQRDLEFYLLIKVENGDMIDDSVKQVIVMRSDLKMRKGKMIAQGCHASMKVFFDKMQSFDPYVIAQGGDDHNSFAMVNLDKPVVNWMNGTFTKICARCESEKELIDLYSKAKEQGIMCSLITDVGKTEFNGVPTNTCIAIGPDYSKKINKITGHLKLL